MTTNMNTSSSPRYASETRAAARNALKPHYWLAVLACLIAAMLGAIVSGSSSPSYDINIDEQDIASITSPDDITSEFESWEHFGQHIQTTLDAIPWGMITTVFALAVVTSIAYAWVGYCVRVGLCRFHLTITDGDTPSIGILFSYFGRAFWRSVGMNVVRNLILFLYQIPALLALLMGLGVIGRGVMQLWGISELNDEVLAYISTLLGQFCLLVLISLLLLALTIPISLRYVMASYVLAENPEVGACGALRESRRMMKGNKWRYFCLQMSFIGWHILAGLAMGVGGIFLAPYVEQSTTEFYHEVSGRAATRAAVLELGDMIEKL